jgi:N-methylhydantoinase B
MTTVDEFDPISIEIHRKALQNIANEMAITITRTSGSPIVYEVQDFATSLMDSAGEHLSMSSTLLFHSASSLLGTQLVIENIGPDQPVRRGDGWILNDPFEGGAMHQGDVAIITPMFFEDDHIGWSFSNVHMADIGGCGVSGFAPAATSVYDEGLRFPATRIIENGELDPNWARYIANNVRVPALVLNDVRSMIAASNVAQHKLTAVIDRLGLERHHAYSEINKSLTEKALRERIAKLPDGTYEARELIEYDGQGEDVLLEVALSMTVEGSNLYFSFRGDDQLYAYINGTTGVCHGWVMTALLTTLGYGDLPFNAGMWRPLSFDLGPQGAVLNAVPPVPLSGGHGIAGQAVMRLTKSALNQAYSLSEDPVIRSRVGGVTDTGGPMAPLSGIGRGGAPTVMFFMDAVAGCGSGAQTASDGLDCYGSTVMPGCGLASIETNEANQPALYLWRRLVPNSGGPGLYRGGQGVEMAYSIYDSDGMTGALTLFVAQVPANGVGGGYPGGNGYITAVHSTNVEQRLAEGLQTLEGALDGQRPSYPSNLGHVTLQRGDVLIQRGAGGGGAGDPILRTPELVAADVRDGYISITHADSVYGVVIDADGSVDNAATHQRRAQIRRARIGGDPQQTQAQPDTPGVGLMHGAGRWVCAYCVNDLGAAEQNWRDHAVCKSQAVVELFGGADMYTRTRKGGPPVEVTEFFCPGCAGLLGTDIHQHGAARHAAPRTPQHATAKEN